VCTCQAAHSNAIYFIAIFIFFIAPAIIVRGASKSYILTLREEKRTKPVRLRTQREKASSGRKRTT
jgi:hypothetical protein